MRWTSAFFFVLATIGWILTCGAPGFADDSPVLWPPAEREFLDDGPGLLLSPEVRRELVEAPPEVRSRKISEFLKRDPVPETEVNELIEAISRRRRMALDEASTFLDDRARVLFLHGRPIERTAIECGATFVPIEIWTMAPETSSRALVFYRPASGQPFLLWIPLDSKRVLYTPEMEYWLQQYEELKSRIRSKRFDLLTCSETKLIDQVTGIEGLTGYQKERPTADELRRLLQPPSDLSTWARKAALSSMDDESPGVLPVDDVVVVFPEQVQQRLVARVLVTLPAGVELGLITEEAGSEHRLAVEGVVEEGNAVFEEFRVRFKLPPTGPDVPVALALERRLRPGREYLVRMHVVDEIDGREARLSRGFRVPDRPQPVDEPPVPEGAIIALGEQLAEKRLPGKDSLLLVPPERDIVLGVWRAEALVTGERIQKVLFLVDGDVQLTRTRPPFSAEVRLAQFPTEQIIRAEGYDQAGELVAADEVVVNQPRGAFRVRILEPARGVSVAGLVDVRAEVVVPDERRVLKVEFFLNESLQATRDKIPWQSRLEVSDSGEISYLTVVATLDDGSRAEQVRFLNAPSYLEEVDVNLVEVLTTVLDRANRPVRDLARGEFVVLEDGRPQEIEKFELVQDLPLTVGFAIDTSGSMEMALPEAQKAAIGFLENLITRRDKVFALGFAGEPVLLIPPTDDVRAVEGALENLRSVGWTALHDALVSSLYYFRGTKGRKALIVLSDGDDSASYYAFRDALEYARRSGVVIYTVGIGVSGIKTGIRRKLNQLAEETGGQAFFIERAEDLAAVYESIENELRSQYLLTYSSDSGGDTETYRTIEIKVRNGKLKARATRG
ncbi:MAG: VWA domain-containing protein, partial [Acidobacteriota bacterium]|nr:VWA domain-containing protein [Acidobacteriota bacterium]